MLHSLKMRAIHAVMIALVFLVVGVILAKTVFGGGVSLPKIPDVTKQPTHAHKQHKQKKQAQAKAVKQHKQDRQKSR